MNMAHADNPSGPPDRKDELLADRALFGLDESERAELKQLGVRDDDLAPDDLSLLVAELQLTMLPAELEPLPDSLARQIAQRVQPATVAPHVVAAAPDRWTFVTVALSAACLLILLSRMFESTSRLDPRQRPPLALRAALVREAPDVLQQVFTATGEEHGPQATGDVVWSNSRQDGFLRIQNLKVNDPTVEQYQLWIFDEQQDEKYPIDGGVFDITSVTDAIIRIHPKLRVTRPTLFAITVEKPGGVVVSDRSRLPLLAKVD